MPLGKNVVTGTSPNPTPPAPAAIDALAEEYLALQKKADEAWKAAQAASEPCQQKADELKKLVSEFGQQHAEKSKLLHGLKYELMSTTGTVSSLDQAAIEKFRLAMLKKSLGVLFRKMFEQVITYRPLPEASAIIRAKRLKPSLVSLFSQCLISKPKSPTLQVREKVQEKSA